jgi:hypothetical protein
MKSKSDWEEDATEEIRQIIEEAIRSELTQRWLTPALLRKAAEEWVDGRNRLSASRQQLYQEAGILTSEKWEYVVPDRLKEPLYSEVLKVMVERGEWDTEPGTNVPQYKRTPTVNYTFKLTSGRGDAAQEPRP